MNSKATIGIAGIAVATLLFGCEAKSGNPSEPTGSASASLDHNYGMGMMDGKCPMQVPTTTVKSADVDGGVALAFTTGTGDIAELRQRVRRMADMHNQQQSDSGMMMRGHGPDVPVAGHAGGSGVGPGHAAGERRGMMMGGGMMMPAVTASVEDIDGGARLVLRPKEAGKLEALREHARVRAERMANGECPMMSPAAEGQAKPPPSAGVASGGSR